MAKELYYELRNGKVLFYDEDGFSGGEETYLRYLRQADFVATATTESIDTGLQKIISQELPKVGRRIRHRETPAFDFVARPINREGLGERLPTISGKYVNPHYNPAIASRTA